MRNRARVYSDIESLKVYAGIHLKKYKNYYRLLSKRFPFAIYYRIEDKNVHIDAVLDCRRDPAWIRDKLK